MDKSTIKSIIELAEKNYPAFEKLFFSEALNEQEGCSYSKGYNAESSFEEYYFQAHVTKEYIEKMGFEWDGEVIDQIRAVDPLNFDIDEVIDGDLYICFYADELAIEEGKIFIHLTYEKWGED